MEPCAAPTASGQPCRWKKDQCPVPAHARWRERQRGQHPAAPRPEMAPIPVPGDQSLPLPVQARDIPGVAWWAVEQLATGGMEGREGGVYSTLLRVLLACNPEDGADADVLAEIELRGRLMHGLPPSTPGQWNLLETRFSVEAVTEVRRWAALFEADALDVVDPSLFRDR
ncbi:MAG: hypothetical protein R3B97_05445 [Dehalococcoidia bacterium]|nr:hypothetical protein [Dehalococcoidia bacterium]MCA9829982.1 hypothetical protein [Dehalococcoidia bacterium]